MTCVSALRLLALAENEVLAARGRVLTADTRRNLRDLVTGREKCGNVLFDRPARFHRRQSRLLLVGFGRHEASRIKVGRRVYAGAGSRRPPFYALRQSCVASSIASETTPHRAK